MRLPVTQVASGVTLSLSFYTQAGDKVKCLMYLELATRRGEAAAAHMRDVILESFSVVNVQHAMSDADKWKPRTLHPRPRR